ncbi:MAG: hemerythrin domain-containing protein [Bacteroidales bacterium]|nr:hemerythrin domain-containing protein [Bacteroidales bacterium]
MKYTENHKLVDIIKDHYPLLPIISRFGIPSGFGDKTVRLVCKERDIDCPTFLAVLNYVANGDMRGVGQVSVRAMVKFLRSSHEYYKTFYFSYLRERLKNAINYNTDNKLSVLIIKFFDSYTAEVIHHLQYEDDVMFKYVDALTDGRRPAVPFDRLRHERQHADIDSTLSELINVIIKYYSDAGKANELNAVLFDIFSCDDDLKTHCRIEDNLFIPAVTILEKDSVQK